MVERWVQGIEIRTATSKRERLVGPGLVVVQGGAPGLDTKVANATQAMAFGLNRRTRAEFRLYTDIAHDPTDGWTSVALADGLWLETYPADWDNLPRWEAGPKRNQQMLDAGADHVVAFFATGHGYGPDAKGGTNDMVRRAHKAGVNVDIYEAGLFRWRKP